MAKKRKAAKPRAGKTKAAKTSKRKTVKRAAARKPARKASKRPRRAKAEGFAARIEHAMAAVLETLTDAERLHSRVARKGVQELE